MPKFLNPITITTPSGSAPLIVNSSTVVTNLNADLLDGQHGSYYQNASNLNAGTVPSARLSGSYAIDITGKSAAVTVADTRAAVTTPQSINMGAVFDFKQNSTEGLNDGGAYFGEMTFRQYGSGTDWSGGLSHQLGFTDNGNIWQRSGSGTTWGAWKKLWDNANDGAGSGLDADLLDGQHGSYFENRDTTAVGFSGGTITLTRAAGNLTVSLDGRYLPLAGGTTTGAVTFGSTVVFGSSGKGRIYADWAADSSTRSFFAGRNSTDTDWNWGAEFGWDGANQRWYFDTVPFINGNQALHAGNYNSYALPLTGGALTGTISIDTTGTTALTSSVIIKRSGQAAFNFGQYTGSWRAALQIQSNASDRLLFLAPPEADYQFGILRSANGGLKIDVGGTTANTGNNAVTIDTAGTANFPVGLQQGGNAVLTSATTSAPNLSIGGNAATATTLSTNRTNWAGNSVLAAVIGQIAWKNYGNNHTIFDASAGTAPDGSAINNTNAQVAWTGTYPTLMGWNGANTYGVRVDSARVSDRLTNLTSTTTSSAGTDNSESCISYINGISLFGQSDGALYSHVYSASWKHNIYGDYRTGQLAVRGKNNGTWTAWRQVLDSSNYASYLLASDVGKRNPIPETSSTAQYVYMGRWVTVQGGHKLRMRVTAGEGYNANTGQNQMTELYFKTSNGSSSITGSTGVYYADGIAFRIGPNPNAPSLFRVVQVDSVTYDIYGYFSTFTGGGSFYEVVISTGTWTHSGTLATPSGNFIDITPSAILHAGNYNSYALPLTGGTLSGALTFSAGSGTYISTGGGADAFGYNSTAGYGHYIKGTGNTYIYGGGVFWDGSAIRTLLHSGNYTSYPDATKLPLAGGTLTGSLVLHSNGGSSGFVNGTGDGANYSTYNFKLSGWNGMAFENPTTGGAYPSQIVGVVDFRNGTIDMKGGFKVNGTSVLTGNQSITLGGDLSGSGTTSISATIGANAITTTKINNSAVTYAKIQNVSVSTVLGNSSASVVQAPVEISMASLAGMLSGQTMNINGSSASCTGNAASATLATKASTLSQGGGTGSAMTFNWSGQSGQPTWLWGGNDGVNHYVYNPSNFDVRTATRMGLYDGTSYNAGSNSIGSSGGRGVSLAPNTYVRQISFEFKNGSFTTIAGNYGGLLTIAPWDGTTASTGDSSYQLFFSSAAANSTSAPVLRVRSGIDTTWGSWATLIHDSNFSTAIPNSGVTAGTYNNVTVNAKGIVTGGSNVSYLTGNQSISLGGDLSGSGTTSITATIANNAVTNAKLNTMGAGTIKGNNGGVANTPSDLTAAQVATMLSGQAMNISGSSTSCTGSAAQLNGQAASYYENRDTTGVSISAGTLTLTRAAGNLTTTIGGRVVAWCDFNGNFASTQTPNANFNVSSITKNATGDYTVNFTSALANANYVVAGTAQLDAPSPGQSNYNVMVAVPRRSGAKATGSCRIVCEYPLGVALYDSVSVGVAFIAA